MSNKCYKDNQVLLDKSILLVLKHTKDKNASNGPAFFVTDVLPDTLGSNIVWKFILDGVNEYHYNFFLFYPYGLKLRLSQKI